MSHAIRPIAFDVVKLVTFAVFVLKKSLEIILNLLMTLRWPTIESTGSNNLTVTVKVEIVVLEHLLLLLEV